MSEVLLNVGCQMLMLELQEVSCLLECLGDDFVCVVNIILYCEGKVVVLGIGKLGYIGKKIVVIFVSIGILVFFVYLVEVLYGDLGMIESCDVMLFIFYFGGVKELDLIILCLEDKFIVLLVMIGKLMLLLGLVVKVVLDIFVECEVCLMYFVLIFSIVNILMMGDVLVMVVMQVCGFNEEDFVCFYLVGVLGVCLLNKVYYLMCCDDVILQVVLIVSVMDVMLEFSCIGLGLVVVCDV